MKSMEAKEYFEKYGESVWEDYQQNEFRGDGPMAKMFIEFMMEVKDCMVSSMSKTRNGTLWQICSLRNTVNLRLSMMDLLWVLKVSLVSRLENMVFNGRTKETWSSFIF